MIGLSNHSLVPSCHAVRPASPRARSGLVSRAMASWVASVRALSNNRCCLLIGSYPEKRCVSQAAFGGPLYIAYLDHDLGPYPPHLDHLVCGDASAES